MQFCVARSAVDLSASGVGPAVMVVEARCAFVGREDPQASLGEAAGPEAFEGGGVELGTETRPQRSGLR